MAQAASDSDDSDPTFQPFSFSSRNSKAESSSQAQLHQSRRRQSAPIGVPHSKHPNTTLTHQRSLKSPGLSQLSATQQLPTPFRSLPPLSSLKIQSSPLTSALFEEPHSPPSLTINPVVTNRQTQQTTLSTQPSSEAVAAATAATLAKHSPTYVTRPNRYFGPSSTWRSWTEQERTIALSLERDRAQDLSIHLYNAYALRRQAELAGTAGGRETRSRSRSRSRSKSLSRSQTSRARDLSKGKAKGKDRDKGKARADIHSSPRSTASIPTDEEDQPPPLTFNPPRLWTAWPLSPNEVPREKLIPVAMLGASNTDTIRSRHRDTRPSAELEECLIAIISRIARERWNARDWETGDEDNDEDERSSKRVKGKGTSMRLKEDSVTRDVQMLDDIDYSDDDGDDADNQATSDGKTNLPTEQQASSPSIDSALDPDPDIQLFSSQAFTTSPPQRTQPAHQNEPEPTARPTFLTDDTRLHDFLLPSTRHIIAQFDELLAGLHRMHAHAKKRKTVAYGIRGWEQVLGVAGLWFDRDVVERTRERCARLFNEKTDEDNGGGED